jgi:hypothetical protein
MATIVDITPRSSRRPLIWVGAVACGFGVLIAAAMGPMRARALGEQEIHRLQIERNGYLRTLCLVYAGDSGDASALEHQAARALCGCVDRSPNPARDCNTGLRVWAVMRDAQRCSGALREEAPAYCACLDPIGQLVTRAGGMDVARRRAYGYDECRKQADVPPLPPPAEPALLASCEREE